MDFWKCEQLECMAVLYILIWESKLYGELGQGMVGNRLVNGKW